MIMTDETRRVFMVCKDKETVKDLAAMFKRVAAALAAVDTFSDAMSNLDEDAPDLADQAAPMIERLTLTLMEIYPNARQFTTDIASIGDLEVRT